MAKTTRELEREVQEIIATGGAGARANPVVLAPDDVRNLKAATQHPDLDERHRRVLHKLAKDVDVRLSDSELRDLGHASTCPSLPPAQRTSLERLVDRRTNDLLSGRIPRSP